jgi:hypothetical protein
MNCITPHSITLNLLNKPPPPPKQRILTLAFLYPNATDAALNRLVARMSKHKVCHVEIVFEDDMAFSIFAGSSVFFRQRSFSNPDYHLISISVSNAEYQCIYNFCKSAAAHDIKFSDYGMYASYLQPKGCPFLNTGESVRIGSTFCSKIVTEALHFADIQEAEHLIPCTTTPSCLFSAFQDSQRKVLSSVPYKREQLRQDGVLLTK